MGIIKALDMRTIEHKKKRVLISGVILLKGCSF
jgi:hypothetical protein